MSSSIVGLAFFTLLLAAIGLAPSVPWFVKQGTTLSLFQICTPIGEYSDDDYYVGTDDAPDDDDSLVAALGKVKVCIMLENKFPKDLNKREKKFFELRGGAVASLGLVIVFSAATVIAGCSQCHKAVPIVFSLLSLIFALSALGCAYEMKEQDDGLKHLKLSGGLFVAIGTILIALLASITTCLSSRGVNVDFIDINVSRAAPSTARYQRRVLQA
eukprot:TRINITY_DN10471_c0_g2_i2.p2 TRINITY_DN10471_c0_g2~~TRINITY_DN10471_c0_g2_i2.p2  ORF type:complete len:215 (+),score=48.16 TRINITY_DN10471_c0_g2_i2:74-718(+)